MSKVYNYIPEEGVLREKASMEKPETHPTLEDRFRVNGEWAEYNKHIASLKSFPASGFNSTHVGRDLVEGVDFYHQHWCNNDDLGGNGQKLFIGVTTPEDFILKDKKCECCYLVAVPIQVGVEKGEFLPPDHGEVCWTEGAETFTRKEVYYLLWTQRAMIGNDLKSFCGNDLTPDMYEILNNPRTPKF